MTVTRRKLVTDSALLGAAFFTLPAAARRAHAAERERALGIQLYTVAEALQHDVSDTLRKVRAIGFREVETAGFAGLSAAEFRRRLDDADLVAPSAHLPFPADGDVAALDQVFADALALGARYAVSSMLRPGTGPVLYERARAGAASALPAMTLDDAKRTAELANRVGERAKRAGLQYAYHNHDFELAAQRGVVAYDELLRLTEPELVKFEIDCGWMIVGGHDPAAYFERHPGRFPLIHVKDFLPQPATERGNPGPRPGAELGRGTIDYAPIFAAANENGLEHFFAEQEGPFARIGQLEAAAIAYDYLRRVSS